MQIRRLRATEWPALRELRLKALEDAPDAFSVQLAEAAAEIDESWRERARRGAEGKDEVVVVAQVDSTLIGMAAGRLAEDEAEEAWLFAMWVEPTQRGDGIGEGLLGAVVDWAKERAAHRLHLKVTEDNEAATDLYLRYGFESTGDRVPLREGSHAQCLTLTLAI